MQRAGIKGACPFYPWANQSIKGYNSFPVFGLSNVVQPISKNGHLLMTLKIGITRELVSWILSFGDHAEVIERIELRTKILDDLKKPLSKYQK